MHNLLFHVVEGIPVIVDYTEPTSNEGHYAVVIGFNKKRIILNDPWNGKDFSLPYKEFERRWIDHNGRWSNRWYLVLSKKEFSTGRQYFPKKRYGR